MQIVVSKIFAKENTKMKFNNRFINKVQCTLKTKNKLTVYI